MADFTGFYFNNKHSSTYHLIRTSDGDRYKNDLFPSFEDYTVEMAGGHGSIYSNTRYKEKEFSISVAFDSVTEKDFREMKHWLEPNKIQEFRFDEAPYKAYWVKLKTTPKFEYLCFMRQKENSFYGDEERVYKGEATLDFIAYNPFGYCCDGTTKMTDAGIETVEDGINWQILDSYNPLTIRDDNITEWAGVSGLIIKEEWNNYNKFITQENNNTNTDTDTVTIAELYNPGDFEAEFELFISPNQAGGDDKPIQISIYPDEEPNYKYYLSFSTKDLTAENKILINTKNHSLKVISIKEVDEKLEISSTLRYNLIKEKSLDWAKIPKGKSRIEVTFKNNTQSPKVELKYSYKYY